MRRWRRVRTYTYNQRLEQLLVREEWKCNIVLAKNTTHPKKGKKMAPVLNDVA